MARLGGSSASDGLMWILRNEGEEDQTRAAACAALGRMAPRGRGPALSLLTRDLNYRSCTTLLSELLHLL